VGTKSIANFMTKLLPQRKTWISHRAQPEHSFNLYGQKLY
jgi:hypothetical protein